MQREAMNSAVKEYKNQYFGLATTCADPCIMDLTDIDPVTERSSIAISAKQRDDNDVYKDIVDSPISCM